MHRPASDRLNSLYRSNWCRQPSNQAQKLAVRGRHSRLTPKAYSDRLECLAARCLRLAIRHLQHRYWRQWLSLEGLQALSIPRR